MLTNTPEFKELLRKGKKRHTKFKKFGGDLKKIPNLPELFPANEHQNIIDALVATCSTKDEIQNVLLKTGFGTYDVEIMGEPMTELKQKAILICIASCGTLTNMGMPCTLRSKN